MSVGNPFDAIEDDQPEPAQELAAPPTPMSSEEHLNSRHIKAILVEKKSLYRQGTYMTIIAAALGVAAGQLVWMSIGRVRTHQAIPAIAFLVVAAGCAIFSVQFIRRTLHYRRAAEATTLPPATVKPDFSTLSDGSQFAKNLGQMHER